MRPCKFLPYEIRVGLQTRRHKIGAALTSCEIPQKREIREIACLDRLYMLYYRGRG
jgi:hypothetical protein